MVVERSSRSPEPGWPAGLERFAEKKYGETRLWFAEPSVPDAIAPDVVIEGQAQARLRRWLQDAGTRGPRAQPARASRSTPARTFAGWGPRAVSSAVQASGHGVCVPVRMMLPG